jgi:lipopolysaccharide assembly outer membrane protein LptD (OstA)
LKGLLLTIVVSAGLLPAQTSPVAALIGASMTAKRLTHDGSILRGTGGVEVRIGQFVLHSDEGALNAETEEIDLRGHARIVLPARTDHTLFRHDSTALITDKAVDLLADRLHVKNMILQGTGHVQIFGADDRLRADEVEIYLNTGDGRVRGNVQSTGPHRGVSDFPPDIIK